MFELNLEQVSKYLTLINDHNPVHKQIVPGQMVVQIALTKTKVNWSSYKVKFIEPIEISEVIKVKFEKPNKLIILNENDKIKIHITKK
ncbi:MULTISPECIES: hypothetical protein [Staphylococcus]|uniref:Uncharacterized protein n=2 Tax=Staphylococcus xylosus TaxID=1288 RepID=A0A418IN14_STAXY|nr:MULTISPECIES: hypothetical protein [Staphylococcus]MBF0813047.1 hypothetical protein [Staphylococcus saprophyticus]MDW8543914.1 hypothetical protein [Staphylococcus sp. KG4-1]MRF36164.1 hypothetical protein [Staphylococcus sp. KY49P]MDW8561342.1 hypothetical protein [Staphylococcus sp. KG4-3]NQD98584.1 hypothetical protein [Staphylococcus xylosus]